MTALGVIGLLVLQWFSQRPRAITPITHDQNFILMSGTGLLLLPIMLWLGIRGCKVSPANPPPSAWKF
ncbi:hypothetical protein HC776_01420 [bacterium]|nr:hypothetical protein [bacterium]